MADDPPAMANDNDELIQRFYAAFDAHDGDAMAACYAPDAHFSDPVFVDLRAAEPGAMWRMLTGRSEDLRVRLVEHAADGDAGSARWIANYTFTQTGRKVENDVRAAFRFRDGLIVDHVDTFSFPKWARQALGASGLLLGWTPMVKNKVRRTARAGLDRFIAQSG
jgi:ketosteroid isomerase-like protein